MSDESHLNWFNISAPYWRGFRLWNCFNRVTAKDGHWWGVGLLQIRNRHLLFVGRLPNGRRGISLYVRAFFLGRTP